MSQIFKAIGISFRNPKMAVFQSFEEVLEREVEEASSLPSPPSVSTTTKEETPFEELTPTEKIEAAPILAEEKAAEKKKKQMRRRTKTILTSPQGILEPASTFQKTLLGS